MTKSVFVAFYLKKGEGDWPTPDILTEEEKNDPRTFCEFFLDLDFNGCDIQNENLIKSCKIIYDGISQDEDEYYGLGIEDDELVGQISPVIEFELSEDVDFDEFKRLVWGSCYKIQPQNAEEPFFAEDWNGYTMAFSPEDFEEKLEEIKELDLYSGKVFNVEELQEGVEATLMW